MSKLDLLKKLSEYDSEVDWCDFTVEELEEMANYSPEEMQTFKDKYFDYYDDIKTHSKKKQDW